MNLLTRTWLQDEGYSNSIFEPTYLKRRKITRPPLQDKLSSLTCTTLSRPSNPGFYKTEINRRRLCIKLCRETPIIYFVFLPTQAPPFCSRKYYEKNHFNILLTQSTPMMRTRRSTKSTANVDIYGTSPPRSDDMDDPFSPMTSIDDSSSTHTTTEHAQPHSTSSLGDLTTSHSTHSIPPTIPPPTGLQRQLPI